MTAGERVTLRDRWTWQRITRLVLVALAIYTIYWLLARTGNNLVPFIVGLVLAYLLEPLVQILTRWMPRGLAILVVYLVGFGAFIIAIIALVPPLFRQIEEFTTSIPSWYDQTLQPQVNEWLAWYRSNTPPNVQTAVDEQMQQAQQSLRANASEYIRRVTSGVLTAVTGVFRTIIFLLGFLIIPFWLFYVLKDKSQGREAINRLIPAQIRTDFWAVVQIFDRVFSGYLRGQLILGASIALLSFLGLTILSLLGFEIQYILLLSLIAGVTELIPVIGPLLGAIPAVIMGFAQSPGTGLAIIILYVIVQQLENNWLVPRIIGGVVEIHPAILMVLLVVGGAVAGLPGIILSAPLAAVARDTFKYIYTRLKETDPSVPAAVEAPPPAVAEAPAAPPAPVKARAAKR